MFEHHSNHLLVNFRYTQHNFILPKILKINNLNPNYKYRSKLLRNVQITTICALFLTNFDLFVIDPDNKDRYLYSGNFVWFIEKIWNTDLFSAMSHLSSSSKKILVSSSFNQVSNSRELMISIIFNGISFSVLTEFKYSILLILTSFESILLLLDMVWI